MGSCQGLYSISPPWHLLNMKSDLFLSFTNNSHMGGGNEGERWHLKVNQNWKEKNIFYLWKAAPIIIQWIWKSTPAEKYMRFLLILVIWEIMIYCYLVYAYLCEYNFPLWNQNKICVPVACKPSSKRRRETNWALMNAFSKADSFCDCEVYNKQKKNMQWGYFNQCLFFKYREEMIKAISMEMII